MKQKAHIHSRGYLLIEAMVAMTVLTTGVLGIFALMSQSIKLTRVINDQYIATYLAAEGIEVTKNLLDANTPDINAGRPWNDGGFDSSGCYEIDINTSALSSASPVACAAGSVTPLQFDGSVYQYGSGSATRYTRTVDIQPIGTVGVRIVSTVAWAAGASSITLEDKFYDWH